MITTTTSSATPVAKSPSGEINFAECLNILRTLPKDVLIMGFFNEFFTKVQYEAVLEKHGLLAEARKEAGNE